MRREAVGSELQESHRAPSWSGALGPPCGASRLASGGEATDGPDKSCARRKGKRVAEPWSRQHGRAMAKR